MHISVTASVCDARIVYLNKPLSKNKKKIYTLQAAPISLRSAKAAINQGLETDMVNGMKIEEQQYAKVLGSSCLCSMLFAKLALHACSVGVFLQTAFVL